MTAPLAPAAPPEVVAQLAALFHRKGYVRRQSPIRRTIEGFNRYKKGDEVRLVANSEVELAEVRRLLFAAGFTPGTPFVKGVQWRQPVYGRAAVARFLELVGAASE